MPRKAQTVDCTCKQCGIQFKVPSYYIRIHGGRQFHNRECQSDYRRKFGLMSCANKNNKKLFSKILGDLNGI